MLICADARRIPLADESVQCVVTSPPYWGLRKYAGEQELIWESGRVPECQGGRDREPCAHEWASESRPLTNPGRMIPHGDGRPPETDGYVQERVAYPGHAGRIERGACLKCGAWRGAYGLEPTVEMYVAHTVEILREVRRVLRKDGVCFWNIGDSYAASSTGSNSKSSGLEGGKETQSVGGNRPAKLVGLKAKDLCLIPMRVALAAQADGWWVRSDIIWAKPNPMPESVTDRPTDAYEHILMLTKSARYFWDAEAVAEKIADSTVTRVALAENRKAEADTQSTSGRLKRCESAAVSRDMYADERDHLVVAPKGNKRNLRNVWTFPTQPYSGAHFATFPEELPRRCILAATSAKGACRFCGAPWERIVKSVTQINADHSGKSKSAYEKDSNPNRIALLRQAARERGGEYVNESQTIGWRPGCACRGQGSPDASGGRTVPCVVLDPFGGSGTTGRVAVELNRRAVLVDLAYAHEYGPLAKKRTTEVQRQLI